MSQALLIIDIQNDFTEGGSLEVPGAHHIIPLVNQLQNQFELVIATQDWHPRDHGSFASNYSGKKPFEIIDLYGLEQVLWPDHCIQQNRGAEFHQELKTNKIQTIFRKGMDPKIDSYSGFYDNGHKKQTGLTGYLKGLRIQHLYFCGLAADYCVYYSIKDALAEGFKCSLFVEATKAISIARFDDIKKELKDLGVVLIAKGS
ncbi:MAG: bifunctional nicotinamidase/pyrazinamidase [Saprospiraceae bacterium]|nr:bifunctional nicotinamidase/pyrazinamidase [Saprospiraceae bacterium]